MEALTRRQKQVLDFIEKTQIRDGVMPSTREIQQHFGFSSQTAAMNHLKALERKGVIHRRPRKARALAIVSEYKRQRVVDIPLYGSIAAGLSETVEQEPLATLSVGAATLGVQAKARLFALKVRGDSMIGAQISDGDTVILEARQPKSGDIVAALIDGETTLKRFVVERGRPCLRAENPAFPELRPAQELSAQGVMVALIRRCGSDQ